MSTVVALVGFVPFAVRRLLTYLHLFQQEEYDGLRFLAWVWREGAYDRRLSLALIAIFLLQLALGRTVGSLPFAAVAGAACLVMAVIERDPRKSAKKKLAMTARATRIYAIAVVLLVAVAALVALSSDLAIAWVLPVQLAPVALVAANLVLAPFEARVQHSYWRDARRKLQRVNPIVVAITGSYGKTSVKHILGHVLESAGPTLITPGSVNTAMGIARVVRERLGPQHRYFVVEMGAYGVGSIRRLCALTPPRLGIISAVGMAHYERFKSLEAVARAKFELGEAVRDNHGRLIVASEVQNVAPAGEFVAQHRDMVVTVGSEDAADLVVAERRQEADGIVAVIRWHGEAYELRAPLYGLHQAGNIALVFAAACTLGMPPEDVITSLKTTSQIAHRLEVNRQAGGAIVIDDGYNSNPVGFASGLALLDRLHQPGGRRILVTPGMVELGGEHAAEHARIGRLAAEHVDILLAVAPHRVAPLSRAFHDAAAEREIVSCPTFADAQTWLERNLDARDVVLIENDLPDILERKLRL